MRQTINHDFFARHWPAIAALIGATFATVGDMAHVASGTAGYLHPAFLGLAWWVPLEFALATLVIVAIMRALPLCTRTQSTAPSALALLQTAILFTLSFVLSGYLHTQTTLTHVILMSLCVLGWSVTGFEKSAFQLALLMGALGTTYEIVLTQTGYFFYLTPDMGSVPSWLPWIYMCASFACRELARLSLGTQVPTSIGMRHVALFVADIKQSTAFYVNYFGMAIEWQPDADNIFLTSGGQDNLALHKRTFDLPVPAVSSLDHIGFVYKTKRDVDIMYARAQQHNIPVAKTIKLHRDGAYSFYLRDPDQHIVQVIYHPPISDAPN